MPRGQQRSQFLNFVGGLNTESSPLVFPENTAKDLDNVDLLRDGSIKRRRGLEFESLGAYSDDSFLEGNLQTAAITEHEWESVDGDDSLNFAVVQVGGVLYFHNLGNDTLSLGILGKIDLDPVKTRTDFAEFPISTAHGGGKLFVVSRGISPTYIQYDSDAKTFSGVKLTIKIRDIDGIPEDNDDPVTFPVTPVNQTDPEDDLGDVISTPSDPEDISPFTPVPVGTTYGSS